MGSDRVGILLSFGFTEYQARVYLALLEFPSLSAGALAKAAQVPRNRLYEVLEELQSLGLVDVTLGRTRMYRANPISAFLDRRVQDLNQRVQDLESRRDYLALAFQPREASPEELDTGATRVLSGRRAVAREIDRLVDEASTSLVAAASVGGVERVFQHLSARADARDLDVEVVLPDAVRSAGGVERLAGDLLPRVRWSPIAFATLAFVADGSEMLLVHPVPDDARLRSGRDFALHTTDAAFVRDHVALLAASRTG